MISVKAVLADTDDKMAKSLVMLHEQFSGIRTGKASPALVENIQVIYYGTPTRLREIAGISTPEARMIVISPYDPTVLRDVEKAILAANLGVTPMNDGRLIRVPIPELTEERRVEMSKVARRMAEDCRIAARNVRRDANEVVKNLQKQGTITEDERDQGLKDIQTKTDACMTKIDHVVRDKEAEIMAV